MKVGILTFHRSYNYGAFLQCYSLLTRLKRDFPEDTFEVIDYTTENTSKTYQDQIDKITDVDLKQKMMIRNRKFERVISTLDLSPERFEGSDISNVIDYLNDRYDAVIVGSDAVWNWNTIGFPNIYFLKGYKGKKLSYAASMHMLDFPNVTSEQKNYILEALHEFSYIGVRDSVTERFICDLDNNLVVYHNCDPTALLDIDSLPVNHESVLEKLEAAGCNVHQPIIAIMGSEYNIGRELKKHFEGKASIASLYINNKYGKYIYDLDPFEWADSFSIYSGVVTNFFHGTMLSLVNGIIPITIESRNLYTQTYDTKIKDLMKRVGFEDHYYETALSKPLRALKKYGLYSERKIWEPTFKYLERAIDSLDRSIARNAIIGERIYYESFRGTLQSLKEEIE